MKLSNYFFKTVKETPTDTELISHQLLIKGGYIKQVSAGIFSYLPIAFKTLKKIENIIREEMNNINGLEINMPVVMSAQLWQETGRYDAVGDELLRFEDRTGRKMLLAMTHEEAVTDMVRYVVNSYKQLPFMLYQIQTKFRDEPRVRGGLIRVREFVMKDAYSFHQSEEDLEEYYKKVHQAYIRIFKRCGLPVVSVASDVGMMGGSGAHEFMALTPGGEDTIIICSHCDYSANKEVAYAKREYKKGELIEKKEVETFEHETIEDVAAFLNIKKEDTLKALVYYADAQYIMAVIRGDLEINETKLKNYLKAKTLYLASDEELSKNNIVKGSATPVITSLRIICDTSVKESSNLLSGANKKGFHIANVNFGRDFTTEDVVDISSVQDGECCPICGEKLTVNRGIEVGNIFKLGTKYTKAMQASFLDQNGKDKPMIMGCYGIGVGRLMASVLELNADDNGIIWPVNIAPFEVELLGLYKDKDTEIKEICDKIYTELLSEGIEVLYDERKSSPGFKFKDAELIGAPIKIAIGSKSLQNGGAEFTVLNDEKVIIPVDKITETVKSNIENLKKN